MFPDEIKAISTKYQDNNADELISINESIRDIIVQLIEKTNPPAMLGIIM